MKSSLLEMWTDPRPAVPRAPDRWGRRLAVVVLAVFAVEAGFRDDLVWRAAVPLLGAVFAVSLWTRRRTPFLSTLAVFGASHAIAAVAWSLDAGWVAPYSTAFGLLVIFSLFRWGRGRDAIIGIVGLALLYGGTLALGEAKNVAEGVGGAVILCFPAVLGWSSRRREREQRRELDRAKLRERERLARELHDTVAHHVSAIAIQAQAGQAVAATRPEAAVAALQVIEQAAASTLGELRLIVSALRDDEDAPLTPSSGLAEIRTLADEGTALAVEVELTGDLEALHPALESALYRVAQESVTNARRHARQARQIRVVVRGDPDRVRVTVRDDGEPVPRAGRTWGFGLIGMAERAALLGGTFQAGPGADGGWAVEATFPRGGEA